MHIAYIYTNTKHFGRVFGSREHCDCKTMYQCNGNCPIAGNFFIFLNAGKIRIFCNFVSLWVMVSRRIFGGLVFGQNSEYVCQIGGWNVEKECFNAYQCNNKYSCKYRCIYGMQHIAYKYKYIAESLNVRNPVRQRQISCSLLPSVHITSSTWPFQVK